MEDQARRHRSSTAASRPFMSNNQTVELRGLADELKSASDAPPSSDTLQAQSNALRRMRQLLIESPEQTQSKDAFRYIQGFNVLLETIRSVSGFYEPKKLTADGRADLFEVIKATLDVLSEALREHSGNGRYFAKRVGDGGWHALEQALGSTGIFGTKSKSQRDDNGQEQLFGCLFAFALGEEAMTRIFRDIERTQLYQSDAQANGQSQVVDTDSNRLDIQPREAKCEDMDMQRLRNHIQGIISGNEVLQNPDVVPMILHFWLLLSGEDSSSERPQPLSVCVLLAIQRITSISSYNKAALHVTGVPSIILPVLFDDKCSSLEASVLREMVDDLITYGVNHLSDAYYLFRKAATSNEAAEFLLHGMRASREPPFIQFDLSLQGYSAIELPELGRPFPPTSSGGGYTFTAWIRVDKFDPNCHTTIFGAFDATETCFVMAYIEKDTRCFILQTSINSSGAIPSIRFKKAPLFEEGKWYHIAVVHKRASVKTMGLGSSKASLYVNGEFTESMKCQYPALPPTMEGSTESFASLSISGSKQTNILAFLGTPQNLAPRLGRNIVCSKLSVASFHLFQEPLSDELIAVHHKLGPRYCGNFQDRLGSFQTYRTSAELHVQNEILHPGKEERSDIVSAIRANAGNLMPENRILISFSPTSVMDDDDRNNVDESQLIHSLSKESALALHKHTRMRGTPLIINAAVPSVNDALSQRRGYGRLAGDPVVVVPQALDDAMWRAGGCTAVGLKLVQVSCTPEAMLRSVRILLEAVEGNWRNCEAMESNNGFAVLAEVLRQKLGFAPSNSPSSRRSVEIEVTPEEREAFMLKLLKVILHFVGFDEKHPTESLIINPLAYRVLLVDLEIWRRSSSLETQQLYYSQFVHFAKGSKHHHYNAKRFHRIRVVKRLMDALKGEAFPSEVFPHFLKAFKVLVEINFSGETARFLALFVTYALHDSRSFMKRSLRPQASTLRLRKATPNSMTPSSTPRSESPGHEPPASSGLPIAELGIAILEMLSELLCDRRNTADIQRFAKNVTNKWLLYLLAEPDQRVVVLGAKILARLLVVNGPHYVKKFSEKSGGFIIMEHRLKSWWNTPGIWTICFAVLLGQDVGTIDFERDFDLFNLTEIFAAQNKSKVVYPEVFPVIRAMLETGLRAIVKDQARSLSGGKASVDTQETSSEIGRGRRRTMSLSAKQQPSDPTKPQVERLNDYATVLNSAIQFLSDIHSRSLPYRDYAASSNYVQELLSVLYPVIVTSDSVSAETELLSRGSALTFEGQDVVIQPLSKTNSQQAPIVRTANVQSTLGASESQRAVPFRRGSSFILISAEKNSSSQAIPRLNPIMSSQNGGPIALKVGSTVVEGMLEVVLAVFLDQLLYRKDFVGLGLYQKTPPGFQEHQAYFESYILRNTINAVSNAIQLNQKLLHEPRVLTNLSRLVSHLAEAVFEGWFLNGAEPLLDFTGLLLEYLQRPDVAAVKSVRLCTQAIGIIRAVFLRVVLLRLADPEETNRESETVAFIEKMEYWQTIILSSENNEDLFLRLICYLLYTHLISSHQSVRLAAANFWRFLLVQKPDQTLEILNLAMSGDRKDIPKGFQKLMEVDNETFLHWIDENRDDLNQTFLGILSKAWHDFVQEQNRKTEDSLRNRVGKRKEKLKQWMSEETIDETVWSRHEIQTNHWRSNVHASERLKHQRVLQDHQENMTFIASVMVKLDRQLRDPCSLFEDRISPKWRLDETEGRNRMRMRIIPDNTTQQDEYQPKRKDSDLTPRSKLRLETAVPRISSRAAVGATPVEIADSSKASLPGSAKETPRDESSGSELEEDFEMVEGPFEDQDGFEDKNRKVMRSLQRGDQVQHVCNVSRIVGLEACEGLLILGKDCLYLLDDFFQRSDGEIVRVWQAPPDERDAYLQMIAGKQTSSGRRPQARDQEDSARHWKWGEVISISKRRFLFRDVAMEIFFADGRSYLLTAITPAVRNELHSKLVTRAPHVNKPDLLANSENAWRVESIRNPEEAPQTFGSRFATVFNSASNNPATKKWLKGEISNFHYLMLVNTLAGRTFNDLTQYPVFPWVLADYTSKELDLTDPRSFRDFTKPMGCQTASREAEFRERYQSFAEMGDHTAQPFHYGTHYSSAMIVASYLIRLQPFVQSYLLLQGGNFDHADRLFSSIERAWLSASRDNMTDVRELTPEFYYLPEFLTNINGYNFGLKNTGERIDDVILPLWAKGDPAIFIAKHREALESPHVTKNLHHWIDLVFGFKQRGDAAVEATNVFHHLSYHGAKDLDNISDPVERIATIGIIHNFGQTPLQVFQRAHATREDNSHRFRRLDNAAESLTRLPATLLDSRERVSSLVYSPKSDRLLCSAAFRHNIPPLYDRYMEWGFTDGSVRFYASDSKKLLGLFEHLHSGQLTTSLFVDGRTLVTAGTDCTVSIWTVVRGEKGGVDLQPVICLFGHRTPVTTLASSRAFSAFLSASADGKVFLWDLNRSEYVRELDLGPRYRHNPIPVSCARINNISGHIMLCCGSRLLLLTLNGRLLLDEEICDTDEADDVISACAFYEGVGNEWLDRELVFTGHRRGVVNIWNISLSKSSHWNIDLIKRLNHTDTSREDGANHSAPITCILPMAQVVYTGDDDGRVVGLPFVSATGVEGKKVKKAKWI